MCVIGSVCGFLMAQSLFCTTEFPIQESHFSSLRPYPVLQLEEKGWCYF